MAEVEQQLRLPRAQPQHVLDAEGAEVAVLHAFVIKTGVAHDAHVHAAIYGKQGRFVKAAAVAQIPERFFAAFLRQGHEPYPAADHKKHLRHVVVKFVAFFPQSGPGRRYRAPAHVLPNEFGEGHAFLLALEAVVPPVYVKQRTKPNGGFQPCCQPRVHDWRQFTPLFL